MGCVLYDKRKRRCIVNGIVFQRKFDERMTENGYAIDSSEAHAHRVCVCVSTELKNVKWLKSHTVCVCACDCRFIIVIMNAIGFLPRFGWDTGDLLLWAAFNQIAHSKLITLINSVFIFASSLRRMHELWAEDFVVNWPYFVSLARSSKLK